VITDRSIGSVTGNPSAPTPALAALTALVALVRVPATAMGMRKYVAWMELRTLSSRVFSTPFSLVWFRLRSRSVEPLYRWNGVQPADDDESEGWYDNKIIYKLQP